MRPILPFGILRLLTGLLLYLPLAASSADGACTSPPLLKSQLSVGATVTDLQVSGSTVLVASASGLLRLIDVSNPAAPVQVGSAATDSQALTAIAINGTTAYVSGRAYLLSFDISNPSAPVRLQRTNASYFGYYGMAVSGGLLFGSTDGIGATVWDVTIPSSMQQLDSFHENAVGYSLAYANNRVFVATGGTGFRIYNVSNPASIVSETTIDTPGDARDVALSGSILYVADGSAGGLRVYSLANPATPALLGSIDTPDNARAVALAGTGVATVADYSSLQIFDVSSASSPTRIGSVSAPSAAAVVVGISADKRYAYVGDAANLDIFDISGCTGGGGGASPTANFTYSPATPTVGQTVSFTDTSTGSPTYWSWNFGDSTTSTARNPTKTYATAGSYTVNLTVTNTSGSHSTSKTVTVSSAGTPPTANFTWSPASPTAGQAVSFTSTSTGSPTSFLWNFGDGGTSTTTSPSHTYASAGSYAATLTATNAAGSNAKTQTVVVSPGSGSISTRWIGAVAHAAGANGTVFRSLLAIQNRGSATANVTVIFHPRAGTAGSVTSLSKTIPASGLLILEDVVLQILGTDGTGDLEIRSDQPIVATSRTYNQTATGTLGQSLDAVQTADTLTTGATGIIPYVTASSAFRTNVGVVNTGTTAATVTVTTRGTDGSALGSYQRVVAAGSYDQVSLASAIGVTPFTGYVTVRVDSGSGLWAFASIVDNATGDPTTVPMQK